ncbi:hypothetical protein BH09GEM1_BH09GEM1_23450 [soil metagenome]
MRLPRADGAICGEANIRDYLLSREHKIGRAKARFFESLGYTRSEWAVLRSALMVLPQVVTPCQGRPLCLDKPTWRVV